MPYNNHVSSNFAIPLRLNVEPFCFDLICPRLTYALALQYFLDSEKCTVLKPKYHISKLLVGLNVTYSDLPCTYKFGTFSSYTVSMNRCLGCHSLYLLSGLLGHRFFPDFSLYILTLYLFFVESLSSLIKCSWHLLHKMLR